MEPGDTLFVENRGYTREAFEPVAPDAKPEEIEDAHAKLEGMKDGYQLNAWTYAVHLAGLKGIRVVNAEHAGSLMLRALQAPELSDAMSGIAKNFRNFRRPS